MVKEDTIINDIILQLIRVSPTLDSNLREEQIRFLTPIEILHTSGDERAFTFYVGKQTPKDSNLIVEDLLTPITSKELYPFYMELPKEDFILRLNKTLYDYIHLQLEQAKASHVPDSDNIWMQPNAEFYNWLQEKGIDIGSIPSFFDIDKKDNRVKWSNYGVAFFKAENSIPFVRLISPNLKNELSHPFNCGLYKNQSEPSVIYEMLLRFATKGKTLNPLDFPENLNTFSHRIQRCNKWLMEKFELSEKPIRKYSKPRMGYTSRINISIQNRKGKDAMDFIDDTYSNPE